MSKDEAAIESEIQAKGLTSPRLTPEHIDAQIVAEAFHVFPGTTLTVCALTLRNGFQVTGESAAASVSNFNEELGRKIARDNARNKIWMLEGYLLRDFLHQMTPERIKRRSQLYRDACHTNGVTQLPDDTVVQLVLDDARRYPV